MTTVTSDLAVPAPTPARGGGAAGVFAHSVNGGLIAAVLVYGLLVETGPAFVGPDIGPQIRTTLWFALLCGLVSFATIEILKRVVGLRGTYQRRQTEAWLSERAESPRAYDELLSAWVAAPRYRNRVFNLPAEQLAAQINSAADVVLREPERFPALFHGLAGIARDDLPEDDDFLPAQLVRFGLDQLQISLADQWQRYIQGVAVWMSGAYGILLTHYSHLAPGQPRLYVLAALLIGAPLAWLARDVAATLARR